MIVPLSSGATPFIVRTGVAPQASRVGVTSHTDVVMSRYVSDRVNTIVCGFSGSTFVVNSLLPERSMTPVAAVPWPGSSMRVTPGASARTMAASTSGASPAENVMRNGGAPAGISPNATAPEATSDILSIE